MIEEKNIGETERKQIVNALINSYDLLEEKLNKTNRKIEQLQLQLKSRR